MRSIFITGGGKGIGLETARLFHRRGWRVGIFDFDDSTFSDIKKEFENIELFKGNVLEADQLKDALLTFSDKNNGIDVLHNNAGIILVGEFDELGLEQNLNIVDINLKGLINSTVCALPYLKKAGHSVIVNMSSASALYGNPELTTYAATKAAVKSLTEGWHVAFQKYGIRVCDLLPIYVKTQMLDGEYEKFNKLSLRDVKLTPELIAGKVWKAVHGRQIHYLVGADTKIFHFLLKIVPESLVPSILRKVLGYKK